MTTSNREDTGAAPGKRKIAAATLGLAAGVGGAGLALLELAFMFRGRETGLGENHEQGCLTLLGILPMLLGGYLCGGLFAVLAIIGVVLGVRSKAPLAVVMSSLGLLAALASLGATLYSQLDMSNW
jgi:hypothetical protein